MNWAKIIALLAASVGAAGAQQTQPPPQTARQALLEMFFGKSPKAFEKHIPETALEIFGKTDVGLMAMLMGQVSNVRMQATSAGSHLETFEAGPLLLVTEGNQGNHQQRVEIAVERDDLSGDEDQIELSMRIYKDGVIDRMPVVPGLVLDMKEEKDVWRLSQITVALRVPLSDPDYVKGIAEDMRKTRQRMVEYQTIASLQALKTAEASYQKSSGSYTCNLTTLGKGWDVAAAEQGSTASYTFKVADCSTSGFHITAEPVKDGPARRALCVDETGQARFANDAKGSACISGGKPINEMETERGGGFVD